MAKSLDTLRIGTAASASHSLRSLTSGTILAATAFLLLAAPRASQAQVVLTFEGLQNQERVLEFYNGGVGSKGSSGTNYGISFGSSALALIDSDAGGTGNFANEPSPDTILYFTGGNNTIMNVSAGFTEGFSVFYSAVNDGGSVEVYDGLDGTGNLLATLELPVTPSSGIGDPTGEYDSWMTGGVTFSGTARSVNFGGSLNLIGFDNITLGSTTPAGAVAAAPEPGTIALLLTAGVPVAGLVRRRKSR